MSNTTFDSKSFGSTRAGAGLLRGLIAALPIMVVAKALMAANQSRAR